MTIIIQDSAIVQFDNASDALQNVSDDIQTITIDPSVNGATYFSLASRWASASEGGIMATVTVNYYNDTSATSFAGYIRAMLLHATSKGGARSFRIQNPDAVAGSIQYDFEARLGGGAQITNKTAGAGDPELLSITFNVDGAITETTIS